MMKYRSRLVLILITLIIVVLSGLGLLLAYLFQSAYYNEFQRDKMEDTELTVHFVGTMELFRGGITTSEFDKKLSPLGVDVILLNENKALLYTNYDNQTNVIGTDSMNNLLQRAEDNPDRIQQIELDEDFYYYAIFMEDEGGNEGYLVVISSFGQIDAAIQQIWWILTVGIGMAFFVIIVLMLKVIGKHVKPIENITNVAIELTNGNYSARAYETSVDEMGILSEAINVLARNLQVMKVNDEMQRDKLSTLIENVGSGIILIDRNGHITLTNKVYKEWFENDGEKEHMNQLFYKAIPHRQINKLVEDVLIYENAIRKQFVLPFGKFEMKEFDVYGTPIISENNEWQGILVVFHDIHELKRLERVRKDFVANVSHELRTPITSIKGFSETLLDGAGENEQIRNQFLGIIHKESERMQKLIEELLELSQIEKSGFELNLADVNLSELVKEIYMLLEKKAEEKHIAFSHTIDKDVHILGDAHRIKQIFINIVNNGILYTQENGEVSIALEEKANDIVVSVKDTGMGIEEEELSRIFERFYRVDKARSRESGGTGLGLAIVKHLAEAHHFELEVDSKVGMGTTFKVIIPK